MAASAKVPLPEPTYDSLRVRFKQLQQQTNNVHQNWQIRVHRSLSWLKRSAALPDDQPETKFILLWISLNSLYGRWDATQNAPGKDAAARGAFFSRVCQWDAPLIEKLLRQHRPLVKKLLAEPYLSDVFWRDPYHPKARSHAVADLYHLDRNLMEGQHSRLLDQVMSRLYVLRGQVVHGASTGGGKLNRKPLNYCLQVLATVVPVVIHVVLEHGCHDDWPELCYPPLGG